MERKKRIDKEQKEANDLKKTLKRKDPKRDGRKHPLKKDDVKYP